MTLKSLFRRVLLLAMLLLVAGAGVADTLEARRLPSGPLGPHLEYLREGRGEPLSLEQARAALEQGAFKPDARSVAGFGLGARPVWVHLRIDNSLDQPPLDMRLEVGMSWLDHVQVYHVQGPKLLERWNSGDEAGPEDGASAVVPGQGFVFPLRLPPASSEVFIRVESVDPIVLPVGLELVPVAERSEHSLHYGYGIIYGYLIALIAYNLIVFLGLRKGSYLLYAFHLSCFIALNLAYTGHGFSLWWSDQAYVQRYASMACIVAWGVSGLAFASRFLGLRAARPYWHLLFGACLLVCALAALCVAFDLHFAGDVLALVFLIAYEVAMVAIGVWALQHDNASARYFTAAAVFALIGGALTALSVWGWIPMNTFTFHAVEIGVLVEATLLALALARDIRSFEEARQQAEMLASTDTLTGLLNRRAFTERAQAVWNTAARRARPLSAAMVDLDHFKKINDLHGHPGGDEVLKAVASLLSSTCRTSDVIARWGGEEFMLLLPETTLEQAMVLAERLRSAIESCEITSKYGTLRTTASFGLADLRGHPNLDALIADADQWLYRAKHAGRNCVMGPPVAPPLPPIMVRDSAFTQPDF